MGEDIVNSVVKFLFDYYKNFVVLFQQHHPQI